MPGFFDKIGGLFGGDGEKTPIPVRKRLTPLQMEVVRQELEFLRKIGFFSDVSAYEMESLVAHLDEFVALSGMFLDTAPWLVAAYDQSRLWWKSVRTNVSPASQAYVKVLQEWSAISLGTLPLEQVTERWQGERGPLTVDFLCKGRPVTLSPKFVGAWIDISLINEVNKIVGPTHGQFFEVVIPQELTAQVVLLPPAHKTLLQQRGWKFCEPHEIENFVESRKAWARSQDIQLSQTGFIRVK